MILPWHVRYYREIFALPGFLADPILVFGVQDMSKPTRRTKTDAEFPPFDSLDVYLRSRGLDRVATLDHFDSRADLRYDMNEPVPTHEHGTYGTLIDIGCLEHVFDTRQCLENCLRMVRLGGHILLHAPVKGYYGHGLHTFHPEGLLGALELNGFRVTFRKYSTMLGREVASPDVFDDVLIWVVAKKAARFDRFTCPQQGRWASPHAAAPEHVPLVRRARRAARRLLGH